MEPLMTAESLGAFMAQEFPQMAESFVVEAVTASGVTLRLAVQPQHLRPGGTVSGPAIFGLVDVAMYLAVLSRIGPIALAVTTNCSIDFMRKPAAGVDLRATARLLKLGRRLAVGDVLVHAGTGPDPVARANLTYAIPPKPAGDGVK